MFRKIVSNLPFSPALVGQLAFYAKRLRGEQVTRKLGLVFTVLALSMQSLALLSPPEQVQAQIPQPTQTADSPALVKVKTAKNLSRGIDDATSQPVRPDERIEYTLRTTNTGNEAISFVLEENLGDALEYGTLKENGAGAFDEANNILSWGTITLNPGQSDLRRLVVQTFATLPATPQAANNPQSYDCVMTNTYGNTINIPVECPAGKIIESTVQQLPTAGLIINAVFGVSLLATAVFFYLRSRQLTKEVHLLRKEFNGSTI
jgi:hypothetical protein